MSRSARDGFTLIELVIVIAIIVIVFGLLIPANRRVRGAAERTQCINYLRQLMLASHQFQSTGISSASDLRPFPTGCIGPGANPEERLSWMVALLPYMEQVSVYQQFDREKGYTGNALAARTVIKAFHCPADQMATKDPVTNYVAMSGIGLDAATRPAGAAGNGFMGYDRLTSPTMIKDGTANTIALMETRSGLGPWARGGPSNVRGFDPADEPLCGDQRPFGGHTEGMHAAMVDGSIRFFRSTIEPKKLAGAITIDGGESVNLD